jgi:DNA-binding GntR family transcriptional regulator
VTGAPRRGALAERAYEHLREAILSGELEVGAVLAEDEVAARIGSSRTPVRQALQMLLQEGLLEVAARRQLVVRSVADHREEIVLVREALEGVALQRACEVMTLEEIDFLRLLLMRQRRAAAAGREDEFIELDEEFHLRIADGAGLPILRRLLTQIRGFVRLMHAGTRRAPGHMTAVIAEHEAIVNGLERRDEAAALDALATHLHTVDYELAAAALEEA